MILKTLLTMVSGFVFCISSATLSYAKKDHQQVPISEVEKYLMGRFNPARHAAFAKVPAAYADRSGYYLRREALAAFAKMHQAANKDGVRLIIRSATRNFTYQKWLWENKWQSKKSIRNTRNRVLNILRYSAMPGTSRHHWGTEVDLNSLSNKWFETGKGLKLFNWMTANAAKYGFHRPYTAKDSKRPFGYNEEKWHWSFTPLSVPMLRDASITLSDTKLRGFSGSQTATEIGIVKHYVLGVSQSCR